MARERIMVNAYLTPEEKQALDVMAKLENRSIANLLKVLIVTNLKERGILEETPQVDGTLDQRVVVPAGRE